MPLPLIDDVVRGGRKAGTSQRPPRFIQANRRSTSVTSCDLTFEEYVMTNIVLWILGVPLSVLLLLNLFGVL